MAHVHRRTFVAASVATAVAPNLSRARSTDVWGTMTRRARDAAYNNSAAVSGSGEIVNAWVAASATFRSQRAQHIDLAYGEGERNKWDLFPGTDPSAPCLVFIHGGYWQSRNREHFSCFAQGLLERGWSVAMPGYTLAPAATLMKIVQETRSALDWLAAQGRAHGIAGPVIISGWSAGGHLTALMLDHPSVIAGLAISGIFELGPIRDTYLNDLLKLTDEEVAALSPLRLPSVGKQLAIAYGTAELPALVRNSRQFHAHRARSHAPGALVPVANANHYTIMETLRSPNGILTRTALRLIEDAA